MKRPSLMLFTIASLCALAMGCATTSAEEQRKAQVHQANSDEAAKNGQFGIAGDEQRGAADAHHRAVIKAIDEGKPIPDPTKPGDPAPAPK